MNPDLLSQLRDIHAAPAAPWWPPAPGWWLLAFAVLLLLIWLGRLVLASYRVRRRRKQILAWVDHLNTTTDPSLEPQAYLATLNRIFKLVALRAFPAQHCAQLAGSDWTEFLREKMQGTDSLDSIEMLATGPYEPAPQFDPQVMSNLARTWIRRHG